MKNIKPELTSLGITFSLFSFISSFFKINTLNPQARSFILKTSMVHFLFTILISFANMFFLLEALSIPFINLNQVAILLVAFLFTESLMAFPAGLLGDKRSFRVVLALSSLFYIFAYRLVITSLTFESLLFAYIVLGLASSFSLENFYSYFDNNYDYYAYEDSNRSIYSEFMGKFIMIKYLITSLGIIIASYISEVYSRIELFNISSFAMILVFFFTILLYKDHSGFKKQKKQYTGSMLAPLKFSWNKRIIRYFIIGIVIAELTTILWTELYSVLIYTEIGKTDQFIGIIYSAEVLITALLVGLLGFFAGKVTRIKFWYLTSLFLAYSVFYFGLSYFLEKNPIPVNFDSTYVIMFLLLFTLISIPYNFNYILYYRTILDLIPEDYRGSIYAIIPTIKSMLGAIILFIASDFLVKYTLQETFYYLGIIGIFGSIIVFFSLITYNFKTTIKEPMGFLSAFFIRSKSNVNKFFLIKPDIYSDLKDYQTAINNIITQLTTVAMEDFQITEKEKQLIDVILTNVQAYFTFLNQMKTEKDLNKSEKKDQLNKLKDDILTNSFTVSSDKTGISEDLVNILAKLQELLKKDKLFN